MMEKPVEKQKENQTKIAKNEESERSRATVVEQKEENQTKINAKTESLEAAAKANLHPLIIPPVVLEQKEVNQTKIDKNTESEAAAKAKAKANSKPLLWDCGSSLYDSFELKSFERQLDSAIHSRTLSMPHLADRRVINHHPPPSHSQQPQPMSKKSSKISRSFHRLLRSVFKPKAKNGSNNPFFQAKEQQAAAQDRFYGVYDRSGVLSTIPEVPEFNGLSPEIKSLVRRTASDRFTVTSIGISCA